MIRYPGPKWWPLIALALLSCGVRAQSDQDARGMIRKMVDNELRMEASDHSRWMYKDAYKSPSTDTVKLIIQCNEANLSELVQINGHAPTPQDHQADLNHNQQLVNDPAFRARQRKAEAHDSQQADDLMKLLPNAFVWHVVNRSDGLVTLAYHPDPNFSPPSMSARVLAAMSGTVTLVENTMRLKTLNGRLMRPVEFGWGLLGHIDAGGTFRIVREEVAPGIWQITQTHVHISGHALFFKTIGDQEDEIDSDWKPVPDSVTLQKAAEMIRDGQLARELGVNVEFR
ncbi:MAG TPA: hypothetical protein VKT75_15870 [Acidobacteriaceae bacterium]|nr:hypothetical protein [Acidobacteriaceae bacterium]